jgi:hypothetical protein
MKNIRSLILGLALLLSLLPVRAFSGDLDYGYLNGSNKRGDYLLSHYYSQRQYSAYYGAYQGRRVPCGVRMTFVPTCFFQAKDKVVAYNYRPVFLWGMGRYRSENNTRLSYGGRSFDGRDIASLRSEISYRLSQPAVSSTRINDYRTVYYKHPAQEIAAKPPVQELPPIGEGPGRK